MPRHQAPQAPPAPEPLCNEPWQNYYILRRGILPCCHGYKAIAPMSEWRTAWNSPALQEIRTCLARGELSPYCLLSSSCPIVQRRSTQDQRDAARRLVEERQARAAAQPLPFRVINRIFLGLPARAYRWATGTSHEASQPAPAGDVFVAAGRPRRVRK